MPEPIIINGKKFITSKQAAALTGYARDYVGQLVRMGKVKGKVIEKILFVSEDSLLAHVELKNGNAKVVENSFKNAIAESVALAQSVKTSPVAKELGAFFPKLNKVTTKTVAPAPKVVAPKVSAPKLVSKFKTQATVSHTVSKIAPYADAIGKLSSFALKHAVGFAVIIALFSTSYASIHNPQAFLKNISQILTSSKVENDTPVQQASILSSFNSFSKKVNADVNDFFGIGKREGTTIVQLAPKVMVATSTIVKEVIRDIGTTTIVRYQTTATPAVVSNTQGIDALVAEFNSYKIHQENQLEGIFRTIARGRSSGATTNTTIVNNNAEGTTTLTNLTVTNSSTSTIPNLDVTTSLTLNGDTITDFVGSGLELSNGVLSASAGAGFSTTSSDYHFNTRLAATTTLNNITTLRGLTDLITTNATTTTFALGSDYITDLTGTGLSVVNGALTVSGATGFSTTSTDYWETTQTRWATTSDSYAFDTRLAATTTLNNINALGGLASIGSTTGTTVLNGNVGVGTSTVGRKLVVDNSTNSGTVATFQSYASGADTGIRVNNNAVSSGSITETAALNFAFNDLVGVSIVGGKTEDFMSSANRSAYLAFQVRNNNTTSEALRVDSSGNVGIGTTSPYAKLSVVGQTVSEYFTATSTTATSTFPLLSSTAFALGSDYITDLTGSNLSITNGALTVTLDGAFSTTSADYWETTQTRWATTSDSFAFDTRLAATTTLNSLTTLLGLTDLVTTRATTTNATSTNLFATTASSTNLYASTFTAGSNALVVTSTGNVGIGTTSPSQMLTVGNNNQFTVSSAGAINAASTLTNGSYSMNAYLDFGSNSQSSIRARNSADLTFLTGASDERMRILQNNGNVGIGTTSPYAKLSVVGQTVSEYFTATSTTATSTLPNLALTNLLIGSDYITDLTGSNLSIVNGALTVTLDGAFSTTSADYWETTQTRWATTSDSYAFGVNLSATTTLPNLNVLTGLATIGSTSGTTTFAGGALFNRNVGIGTTTALAKLQIVDNTTAAQIWSNSAAGANMKDWRLGFTTTSMFLGTLNENSSTFGDAAITIGRETSSNDVDYIDFAVNNEVNKMRFTNAGNFGIGTTTPQSTLSVAVGSITAGQLKSGLTIGGTHAAASGGTSIDFQVNGITNNMSRIGSVIGPAGTEGELVFYTTSSYSAVTPTEKIRINGAGNLGIGTTSPYAKLSVVGQTVSEYFTATSTTATSTFPNLSTTNIAIGSDYITDLTGAGILNVGGALTLDTSGLWATTSDSYAFGVNLSATTTLPNLNVLTGLATVGSTSGTTTFAGGAIFNGSIGIGTTTFGSKLALAGGNFTHTASGTPTLAGTYNSSGQSNSVYVSGKYAYVADGTSGIQIVDTTIPQNPNLVGTYDTSGTANQVYVAGDYAYVADDSAGLQVINITNPKAPTLTSTYDTTGTALGVYVSGKYVYVTDGASGLHVFDASNPAALQLLGTYNTTGTAYGVYVSGKYAYVADYTSGLVIIDVSSPTTLNLVGSVGTTGAYKVYVSGKYAYVADNISGLVIIDVSNPASPSSVGSYNTSGIAQDVYVSGKYAYVSDNGSGFYVIDIQNAAAPSLVGTYDTSGNSYGVFVSGKYAYVADYLSGLQVFDINGVDTPTLFAGNINTGVLTVSENVDIGNSLYVRNGLNIGRGGISSNGVLSITGTSTSYFAGNVGLGTTTPYAKLSVAGQTVADYFTATSTTATSTFPLLSASAFALGSDYITDLTGSNLSITNGALTVTLDGAFSTTSADYWETTQTRWATTSDSFAFDTRLAATTTLNNITTLRGLTDIISTRATTTNATSTNFFATTASTTDLFVGGSLGMGTSSPQAKLSFADHTTAAGGIKFGSDVNLYRTGVDTLRTDDALYVGTSIYMPDNTGFVNSSTGNNAFLRMNNAGALFTRNVADSNPTLIVQQLSSGSTGDVLQLKNNASTLFVVQQDGDVGIGTTSPYAKLSVVGQTVSEYFTATSTTATSTFPLLSVNALSLNGTYVTSLWATTSDSFAFDTRLAATSTLNNLTKIGTQSSFAFTNATGSSLYLTSLDCTLFTNGGKITTDNTGMLTCANDNSGSGGGGGTDVNWTFFNGSGISVSTTSNQVVIGASATSSLQKLQVSGGVYITGSIGVGTSSPSESLSINGNGVITGYVRSSYFTATTTTATSTLPNLALTNLLIGSDYITDLTGSGLSVVNGALTVDSTSAWATTSDSFAFDTRLAATTTLNNITTLGGLSLPITQTTGTLSVARGGTGQTSFGQGWLSSDGATITSSTSPTVAYITATSTTATSTLHGNSYGADGIVLGANDKIYSSDGLSLFDTNNSLSRFAFSTNNTYAASAAGQHRFNIGASQVAVIDALGNLGIGTSSPYAKLSVTNTGTAPSFLVEDSTSPDTTPFIVDASGNVGIGTLTPSTKLNVWATNAAISVGDDTNTSTSIAIAGSRAFVGYDGFNAVLQGASGKGIELNVNNGTLGSGTALMIDTSGNVGIGTTSPYAKLSVVGQTVSEYFTATSTTATSTFPKLTSTYINLGSDTINDFTGTGLINVGGALTLDTSASGLWATTSANYNFGVNLSATTTLPNLNVLSGLATIGSTTGTTTTLGGAVFNGLVGIGTTSPSAKLSVTNTGSGPSFLVEDSTSPDATPFIIDANGNVGVGTSTPLQKFVVTGQGVFASNSVSPDPGDVSGSALRVGYYSVGDYGYVNAINSGAVVKSLILNTNQSGQGGNVGIGTTTPGQKLEVMGVGRFDGTNTFSIGSDTNYKRIDTAGSAGQIFRFLNASNSLTGIRADSATFGSSYGSATAPSNGILVQGNVGIGTSSPASALHIEGTNSITGGLSIYSTAGTANGRLAIYPSGNTSTVIQKLATNGVVSYLSSTGVEEMRIDAAGNIGIGTTSPYAKLSVVGQTVSEYFTATSTTATSTFPKLTSTYINLGSDTLNDFTGSGILNVGGALTLDTSGLWATTSANYNFGVNLSATTTLPNLNVLTGLATIGSTSGTTTFAGGTIFNGNVGVGTTTPGAKLVVQGDSASNNTAYLAQFNNTSDANGYLRITNNYANVAGLSPRIDGYYAGGTQSGLTLYASTNNTVSTVTEPVMGFKIANIAAGATQPAFQWSEGSSVRMTIDKGGNIGIGTTSPYQRLSVSGSAVVNGNILASTFTATSTTATSTFPLLSSTAFALGSDYVTDLTGSNLSITNGALTVTLDGAFSTTSADYWETTQTRWATTSANYNFGVNLSATTTLPNLNVLTGLATIGSTSGTTTFAGGTIFNGNVGVGTTSPSSKLEVNGNAYINGVLTIPWTGNNALPSLVIGADPAYGLTRVNGSANIAVISNGAISAQFTSSGISAAGYGIQNSTNAQTGGLGMTTGSVAWGPSTTMDVNLSRIGVNTVAVGNGSGQNTSGTLIAGNIGVGTTSPYAKLSVVGQTVSEYFTATSTTATSTFPLLSVNALSLNGVYTNALWATTSDSFAFDTRLAATTTLNNITTLGGLSLPITQTTGTLSVARGGTGQTSFGQGWLSSDGTTITSSTSPTVAYLTSTSTATSTFRGGIDLTGTGCFAINGGCIGGGSSLTGAGAADRIAYWTGTDSLSYSNSLAWDNVVGRLTVPTFEATASSSLLQLNGVTMLKADLSTGNFYAGQNAGNATTTGQYNTAVGLFSLSGVTTGTANSAFGRGSLLGVTTGSNNIGVGYNAAVNMTTGDDNIAIGTNSLGDLDGGSNNIAIGEAAGASLVSGTNNLFIGSAADTLADGVTNATAIGYNAKIGISNAISLGDVGTFVGIGTSSPFTTLSVNGQTAADYFTAVSSSATSTLPLLRSTRVAINGSATANDNLLILDGGDDFERAIAFNNGGTQDGYLSFDHNLNDFKLWNKTAGSVLLGTNNIERLKITSTGYVGIGSSTPYERLSVAGHAVIDGTVRASIFTATSTTATSTFPLLSVNALSLNGQYVTSLWATTSDNYNFGVNLSATTTLPNLNVLSGLATVGSSTGTTTVLGGAIFNGNFDVAGVLKVEAFNNDAKLTGKAGSVGGLELFGGSDYNVGAGIVLRGASRAIDPDTIRFTRGAYITSMLIDSEGYVGVGTTSPYQRLSVNGSAVVNGNILASTFTATSTTATSTFPLLSVNALSLNGQYVTSLWATTSDNYNFGVNLSATTTLPNLNVLSGLATIGSTTGTTNINSLAIFNQNVGIGTTSPAAFFAISNSATTPVDKDFILVASTTAGVSTTTLFKLASSGNISIGTTTDNRSKLEITNYNVTPVMNIDGSASGADIFRMYRSNANGGTGGYGMALKIQTSRPSFVFRSAMSSNSEGNIVNAITSDDITTGALIISTSTAVTLINTGIEPFYLKNSTSNIGLAGTSTPFGSVSINGVKQEVGEPTFVIGSSTKTDLIVTQAGAVGVATTSSWTKFAVKGRVAMQGLTAAAGTPNTVCMNSVTKEITENAATSCITSDRDQKQKIQDLTVSGLDAVRNMKPVTFAYNDFPDRNRIGFIAQDVQVVDQRLGDAFDKGGVARSIDLPAIMSITVKAVQELDTKVDAQASTTASQFLSVLGVKPTTADNFLVNGDLTFKNNFSVKGDDMDYLYIKSSTGSDVITFAKNGNVGIGTSTPAYKLQIAGDIAATAFVNVSTRDAKKNISYLNDDAKVDALEELSKMKIANYRYKTDSNSDPLRLGLIAEEAPASVLSASGKGVDLYKLTTFTLAAVQAQQKNIEAIDTRLAALEAIVASSTPAVSEGFIASVVSAIKDLTLAKLEVGTQAKPSGITLFDEESGEPYCIKMSGGTMKSTAGACGTTAEKPKEPVKEDPKPVSKPIENATTTATSTPPVEETPKEQATTTSSTPVVETPKVEEKAPEAPKVEEPTPAVAPTPAPATTEAPKVEAPKVEETKPEPAPEKPKEEAPKSTETASAPSVDSVN